MRARVREVDVGKVEGLPPRERPAYTVAEVSHYVGTPAATVRAWVKGQAGFRRVLHLDEERQGPPLLSFLNLVEVHVLDALRRHHRLPLSRIRRALGFLSKRYPKNHHPLAELDLRTDGFSLFIDEVSRLVNATQDGQLAIKRILEAYLERIDRDVSHVPVRLYPFTRRRESFFPSDEPRLVVIDPEIAFGRPVLSKSGTPTDVIAERFRAGESIGDLSQDYGRPVTEIEEALRCERAA
jgi:uncharacterized protein (DUF433 family)